MKGGDPALEAVLKKQITAPSRNTSPVVQPVTVITLLADLSRLVTLKLHTDSNSVFCSFMDQVLWFHPAQNSEPIHF